jgi:acyl-CoA synthetase (AMP-forming)/AMP-acid ligase II
VNIAALLELAVQMDGQRAIATDPRRTLTVRGLAAAAAALAQRLAAEAPGNGAVAMVGVNSVVAPIALFGAALAGRAYSPLNYRADPALLRYMLDELQPSAVVADEQYREAVTVAAAGRFPLLPAGEVVAASTAASAVPTPADAEGAAVLLFTSGTSARPKTVVLRHRHLAAYVIGTVAPMAEPPAAATLVAAPPYHIAATANMLTSTYGGRRMVFLPAFNPKEWLETAEREGVTHAFVVPTMLHRIVGALREGAPAPSLLATLAYGGAPAAPELVLEALARFAPSTGFVNAYGLTETSSTISVLGPQDHRAAAGSEDAEVRARIASAGRPLPGVDVRIDGDHGTGEILVRGGQVSGEYAGRHPAVDAEGWFHTGDLGRRDAAGYLFIVGRLDDMIIRGGENISPVEIENVLAEHPAVAEAAAVGVSDAEWGQRVAAAVVLIASATEQELIDWVRGRLPGFKTPTAILVVSELPRNDLGKLQRFRLREQFDRLATPQG